MEALAEIDPGWAPQGWDVAWQRSYRLLLAHVKAGGTLPIASGEVVVQGEDLAAWISTQRAAWDGLAPAQRFLLETVGVDPEEAGPVRPVARSQTDRWETNLTAARQFHAREGHLQVPRKHVETISDHGAGGEGGQTVVKLRAWLDNTRRRAAKLRPERRTALNELGMRW
jgi:hypothetical protein